jgi:stage V sporulation protein B
MFNTLLLTATSFLMQTVSVAFHVYLGGRIGSTGIGLFELTMTVYGMAATFACAGVRLGSTRLTTDLLARNPAASARSAMRLCLGYALGLSLTVGLALLVSAPVLAAQWLKDPRTAVSLRWLALGLPFVSVSAACQGYFTAVRTVFKSAAVQAAEQAVRIGTVVACLGMMLPRGIEYACQAIVIGMCAGEAVALTISLALLYSSKPMRRAAASGGSFRDLLHIAGPDAAGTCIRSVLLTTEHLLIPQGFRKSGRTSEEAMRVYGAIHGMTLPVLLYPSAILSSLAGLLVPEMAQYLVRGQKEKIDDTAQRILHLSLLYGIGVAGMFYAFARPLATRIYGNDDCARYFQLLAPLVPVMYLDMSVDGMLKGLDQQKYSMRYNIYDSGMCVVLVFFLLPRLAIKGYMIVLFASEIFNFALSLRRLLLVTNQVRPKLSTVGKPLLCIGCATLIPLGIARMTKPAALEQSAFWLAAAILGGALVYFLALWLIGSIEDKDIALVRRVLPKKSKQPPENGKSSRKTALLKLPPRIPPETPMPSAARTPRRETTFESTASAKYPASSRPGR